MGNNIIRRRLKSLREREAMAKEKSLRSTIERNEKDARVSQEIVEAANAMLSVGLLRTLRKEPIVLPMTAFYAREPEHEARRAAFYAYVALVYGSQGWMFGDPTVQFAAEIGYGGGGRTVKPIDQESAAAVNIMAAPFEWLISTGKMESKLDTTGAGLLRYTAGLRYRADMEGAGLGLQAQSYEGASGGGQPNRPPSDFRMDCITAIAELRGIRDYDVLEAVVWRDEWIWRVSLRRPLPEGKSGKKHRRQRQARAKALKELQRRMTRNILKVHRALDQAARFYGLMNEAEYDKRWKRERRKP